MAHLKFLQGVVDSSAAAAQERRHEGPDGQPQSPEGLPVACPESGLQVPAPAQLLVHFLFKFLLRFKALFLGVQ